MAISDAIGDIVSQHAEEAGFLWRIRKNAVAAPNVAARELRRLDERIEAHIDGLRIAGEAGTLACAAQLASGDPGSMFIALVLSLEGRDLRRVENLLALSEAAAPMQSGMLPAFGWVSSRHLQGIVRDLIDSPHPFRRYVGIACCGKHRVDPGGRLDTAMRHGDVRVRARALRSAGELGRQDLAAACEAALQDDDPECRVAAARSAVLLGDRRRAVETLTRAGLSATGHGARASRLALQAMSMDAAHRVLQALARDPRQRRWLIQGSGLVGDPAYVKWLIGLMDDPAVGRLAGEAFSLITGADLTALNLEGKSPGQLGSGPSDDPDDPNVDMDPDGGLPWPDAAGVGRWWAANSTRFQPGTRYFMGAPVTRTHCIDVLKNGYQRQRILAAHYLCLLEPGTPLFNTSAPAWRQQRLLAQMS